MSQALDDAFANVNARLDAQDAATTANTVLLEALVVAVQSNPTDPTVVSRLQEVADRIDAQTKKVTDADSANPVPTTP